MVRKMPLFVIALVALLLPLELAAQSAIVTGTVRNQQMAPVRGAAVNIPALNLGTVTNDAGFYRIVVPEARVEGQQVTVTAGLIGYRAAEATATLSPGVVRLDITMTEQAIALDEILVTGTAGRQARRAQSAVVGSISAADLMETAPVSSMTQILQSRMPGVSVQQAGGTVGGTQVIRIRGQSSLSLSNEPLVFIDGVRMDQRTQNVFEVGGQRQSRLNDIAPEDIEDIQIVKGPAAATLYGADASAGVINIITKRGREGTGFTQSISVENQTHSWDHFTPEDNFGVCDEDHVENPNHRVCAGQAVGTVVSDNPLLRTNSLLDGHRRSLNWSGRGGGENHGYYLSLGGHDEAGAFANNRGEGISGRANFDFQPTPNLRVDAGMGVSRTRHQIPRNDNNIYGWLGGSLLGSPLSAGHDSRDGWYAANRGPDALAAQDYTTTNVRAQPRLQLNYSPTSWMTNRIVFGADLTRLESRNFFPKNDNGWFAGVLNTGQISQRRNNYDRLTFDYLGNISTFLTEAVSSDISFGTQILHTRSDWTGATGIGLTTNAARDINRAATATGEQWFSESRQLGFMGQWQVGYADRVYVQIAGRVDQHSAFGVDAEPYFSPKVGISYVISDEPFWQRTMPEFLTALRLRAAYGTTGRSPVDGNLATYTTGPYALEAGGVGPGVVAQNPGNVTLAPERGTEFEAGFEMSLFEDRLGLELTYFDQNTRDAILNRPLPPSQGFTQFRRENIGEVMNRGVEFAADARLVSLPNFGWQARVGMNSLTSRVVDLGEIAPFWSGWWQRVEQGHEANSFFTQDIIGFEQDGDGNLVGIVTEDDVWVGNYMPDFEGNFSNTFTFFRDFTVYGLLDWKQNFVINNNTSRFRNLSFGTSEAAVRCGSSNPAVRAERNCHLSDEDRVSQFGPFVTYDEDGNRSSVSRALVNSAYLEDGSFVRLREISLSYRIPSTLSQRFGASGATLSAGGRNLALWTDYSLADPEVGLYIHNDNRDDFLTLPTARSYFVRLNFQF